MPMILVTFVRPLVITQLNRKYSSYLMPFKLNSILHYCTKKKKKEMSKQTMSRQVIPTFNSSKPIRMWIDGKCFNIKEFKSKTKKSKIKLVRHVTSCGDAVSETVIETEIAETANIENKNEIDMVTNADGKMSTSFQLPSMYYIRLGNFNEFDLVTLSRQTQTEISFPKHGKDGKLTIAGENESNIHEALTEIHSVISEIRNRNSPLQFISIPLLSDEIKSNFAKFKNEILSEGYIEGMEESIFQSVLKLHLTIEVFTLLDQREIKEAIDALDVYHKSVLCPLVEKNGPLKIRVSGVDCMNDNYRSVNVMYANAKIIDETDEINLQNIVNDLSNFFYDRGLVSKHRENVKLHMTLINTKYRKVPDSPRRRWIKRVSFNATKIMGKYKDYNFGECNMDSVHVSLISSEGDDGFYQPLSIVKI